MKSLHTYINEQSLPNPEVKWQQYYHHCIAPKDSAWKYIDKKVTIQEIIDNMEARTNTDKWDKWIGGDSIVRERLFNLLARLTNTRYKYWEDIYFSV